MSGKVYDGLLQTRERNGNWLLVNWYLYPRNSKPPRFSSVQPQYRLGKFDDAVSLEHLKVQKWIGRETGGP